LHGEGGQLRFLLHRAAERLGQRVAFIHRQGALLLRLRVLPAQALEHLLELCSSCLEPRDLLAPSLLLDLKLGLERGGAPIVATAQLRHVELGPHVLDRRDPLLLLLVHLPLPLPQLPLEPEQPVRLSFQRPDLRGVERA
jgi:hypothetical protein